MSCRGLLQRIKVSADENPPGDKLTPYPMGGLTINTIPILIIDGNLAHVGF
jgi:hypothetical protein